MKIGFFATWLARSAGGIENMCYNVFNQLRQTHEVTAFSLKVNDDDYIPEGVYYASTAKRTVPVHEYLHAYRDEHKRSGFDINIAMHVGTGIVTMLIKLLWKTPYIVYVHGKEIKYGDTFMHRLIYKYVLKHASMILANSRYTASLCADKLSNKVRIIHPGVNDELVAEAQVAAHTHDKIKTTGRSNIADKTIKLFTVSRLVKRKGIDTSLVAVRELIDSGYNVEYIIAGDGEYAGELKKLTDELGISKHVTFSGKVSEEEKIKLFSECDLFIMPSYDIPEENEVEGFGIVYVEANAFGKFVIAGNNGGVPDAVKDGETGYMTDGQDPDVVKNAIIKYMNKQLDEKTELAYKCKQWAQEHDWSKLIEQWHEVMAERVSQ